MERYQDHIWPRRVARLLSGMLALQDSFAPNPWILVGLLGVRWEDTRSRYQDICQRYEHVYLSQGEATQLRAHNLGFSRVLRIQSSLRRQGRRRSTKLEESVVVDFGVSQEIAKRVVKSATYVHRFITSGPERVELARGLSGASPHLEDPRIRMH